MSGQTDRADAPVLRMVARGHPEITATHAKTIELIAEPQITRRASCVVGVGALTAISAEPGIAGPVRITVRAAGHAVAIDAVANPDWRPGGSAVIRRSATRLADTLAVGAEFGAADLPREMTTAMTDPATEVELLVHRRARRIDGRTSIVLLWMPPHAPPSARLIAEAHAADAIVAEDDAARDVLAAGGLSSVAELVHEGEVHRVLVVATAGLPGGSVAELLAAPDEVAVEVAGLPADLAVAAASPRRGPIHLAGRVRAADAAKLLRAAPAHSQLVVTIDAKQLPDLLERAAADRGTETAAVAVPMEGGPASWGPIGDLTWDRTGGELVCCLDAAEPAAGGDEQIARLAAALLEQGVPARSVALAVAQLPDWSRRRAYDVVTKIKGSADGPQ